MINSPLLGTSFSNDEDQASTQYSDFDTESRQLTPPSMTDEQCANVIEAFSIDPYQEVVRLREEVLKLQSNNQALYIDNTNLKLQNERLNSLLIYSSLPDQTPEPTSSSRDITYEENMLGDDSEAFKMLMP